MKTTAFVMICFFLTGCASAPIKKQMKAANDCKSDWRFFVLKTPVEGKIVCYNPGWCRGYSKVAASAIVATNEGDTIRVLDFCNSSKFKVSDAVSISPSVYEPENARSALNIDMDCRIKRTCYGNLKMIAKNSR